MRVKNLSLFIPQILIKRWIKTALFAFFILALQLATFNCSAQTWLWAKNAPGKAGVFNEGCSVTTDASGNVFVTGAFQSMTITFGTIILINANTGNYNLFIAKYDPNGNVLWAKSAGGASGFSEGLSISADPGGNVFVTGNFSSPTITFGTTTLINTGSLFTCNVFITKYDANGNVLWAKSTIGTGSDLGLSLNADAFGNAFVTGVFQSPVITFGSTTLTNAGPANVFLAKYDTNGNVLWAQRAGGTNIDGGMSVSADASGNVFVTGLFNSPTITFGATTLTNAGGNWADVFLAKYDAIGTVLWAKRAGGTGDDEGESVSADPGGNVFVTGYFKSSSLASSSITFGTTTLTVPAGGNYDVFIAKYDPNGNVFWAQRAGGTNDDKGYSVSADVCGNVFLTGAFDNPIITFGSITLTPPPATCNFACDPMFVVKYDANGNALCASALASGGDDQSYVSADPFGNVYIGGDFAANPFNIGSTNLPLIGTEDIFVAKYTCGSSPLTINTNQTNAPCGGTCAGTATVTPSGGTSPYTYLWNPSSQTSSAATGLCAGTYTVTVNDASCSGNSTTATITITASSAITASVSVSPSACLSSTGSATVTPSGGTPAYTYLWSPSGGTNASATGLSAGSYTVTVTDAGGCSETAAANISNTGSPWGYISSIGNVACNGLGSGMATVTVTIGTAPFTYLWDNGQTTASATGLSAGSHQVTITDGLGCIVIVDTTLTQPAAITTSVTSAIAACGKPDGTAGVTPSGGTPGYIYLWSPSGGTNATVTGLSGGTYSVTITDANGCTAVSTVSVSSSPSVTAAAGPNATICGGQMVTLNASGGTSYLWSNGITTSSVFVSPSATTTYSVIVSAGACSDTAYAAITVNPSPIVSVSGSTLLCRGDIATLTASGGTTYLWSNGSTTSVINVSPTATTTYTVVSSNGFCAGTNTVTVSVSPPPVASASNATICAGENATLDAAGGGNYLWNNGATSSSIQINPTTNTSYSVIVSIGTCSDTANATVTVNALPTPVAWSNVTITAGMSATLSASGGASYSWIGGASGSSVTVSPAITTIYCVWVSNNDCRDSACVTVTVEPMDCSEAATGKLYLPDAFSPNNDGENDFLRIYFGNMLCIKSFELHLYNRWGEPVFETNDPDFRWDGSYKSKPENTAVFVYYMNATLITGEKITKKGNVGLLR